MLFIGGNEFSSPVLEPRHHGFDFLDKFCPILSGFQRLCPFLVPITLNLVDVENPLPVGPLEVLEPEMSDDIGFREMAFIDEVQFFQIIEVFPYTGKGL